MSLRLAIVFAATVALGAGSVAIGASQAAPAPGLDYDFFKTKVEPVFMKKRPGHSPCVVCHTGANNLLRLEELAPGQTTWNEEQSHKMFDSISKLVHSGGRQFENKDDPDYKILMQWVGVQ